MSTSTKARNRTIDILRLTAAFAVICLHNFSGSGVWAGEVIVTLSRFAVPLFFLFSGYFSAGFSRKRKLWQVLRIFTLTLLSNLAYLALVLSRVPGGAFMVQLRLQELLSPLNWQKFLLLNESPFSSHLWFLGALLYCLTLDLLCGCLFGRFIKKIPEGCRPNYRKAAAAAAGALLAVGLILYDICVIGGKTTGLTTSFFAGPIDTLLLFRNFFFFGLPFFLFGKLIRHSNFAQKPLPNLAYALGIPGLCALALVEQYYWGVLELYCGSILLAFLLMHLALCHPLAQGGTLVGLLGWLGQNTSLTIYIVHIYFLDLFRDQYWANFSWQYEPGIYHLIPIGVFLASLLVGVAVGLAKSGLTALKRRRANG